MSSLRSYKQRSSHDDAMRLVNITRNSVYSKWSKQKRNQSKVVYQKNSQESKGILAENVNAISMNLKEAANSEES